MSSVKSVGFERSNPQWAGESLGAETVMAGGFLVNPTAFVGELDVVVTAAATAAIGATSITVAALSGRVPVGAMLVFDGNAPALVTAEAKKGETVIAVAALAAEVADTEVATYHDPIKVLPAGTVIGRTFAERATNTPFEPAVSGDDEVYLLAFDVPNAHLDAGGTAYKPGGVVRENMLPNWATLGAAVQALVRANYATTLGQA